MTKEEVMDLISDSGFCFLATTEGNQPRVRPMVPYLLEDDKQVLIALLGRSRTVEQIKANPLVELCCVDRKMWYCRVTGEGSIQEDKSKKELLWNNVPMLKQYFGSVDDPDFTLLVIDIKQVEAMTPHQKDPEMIEL